MNMNTSNQEKIIIEASLRLFVLHKWMLERQNYSWSQFQEEHPESAYWFDDAGQPIYDHLDEEEY